MSVKEAYQEKAGAQLREWQERVERIKAYSGLVPLNPPSNEQRSFKRLDDCCHIAQLRLNELRISREERWEFAKQAVERAMIDLKRALDESGIGPVSSVIKLQTGRDHVYEPFRNKKTG